MRDWFAAFAPDQNAVIPKTWATRATRATATRKARKSSDSGWQHAEHVEGNKRATRATEAHTGAHAEHSVAPVARLLPKPEWSSDGARSPENQGLVPPVAHVAHVALHSDEVWTETPDLAWNAEDWQVFFDERASILKQDDGLTRQSAESRAFECTIVEWLNRHPHASDPGYCAWCAAAETSDAHIVPFGTSEVGHCWLHPACWRPWHDERRQSAIAALAVFGIGKSGKPSR